MTGSIVNDDGRSKKRADNLIYADEMQPVVIEAAFAQTADIDGDAISRLGWLDGKNHLEIMTAVALVIPNSVKKIKGGIDGVRKWLKKGGEFEYAVYSLVKGDSGELPLCGYDVRYPDGPRNSGYIRGTVADLADLIELAATPDKKIKQTAERVGGAVRGLAALMHDSVHKSIRSKIADKVGQPADVHAMRVAACVWLNALVLHGKLARALPNKITSPHKCKTWRQTTDAWKEILRIDYKSVFHPALESLTLLSNYGDLTQTILSQLNIQAELINDLRLGGVADVSSDMLPELATDRKVTAAYYTRPEVAELLAGLGFNLISDNRQALNIADFACGTGALLKAAYRQVRRHAEPNKKTDMSSLHRKYIENHLYGADIQPIAAHLTAAGLAGMHPAADYRHSNIICADVRNGKTGSLELLQSDLLNDLFGVAAARSTDKSSLSGFRSKDGNFDLCIMNPPYSRPHGGRKIFGVEGLPDYQRKKSVSNLKNYLSGSFANLRAGMASAFCYLADKKLKAGGVLAAVLPITAASQVSWRQFRSRMLYHYSEVLVVGIASCNDDSFSADTGMGEMLICARKNSGSGGGDVTAVNLYQLPRDFVEAHEMARALRNVRKTNGGGKIAIGGRTFATCIKIHPKNGNAWGAVGAKSKKIAVVADNLLTGTLIKLGSVDKFHMNLAMKPMKNHVTVGPSHDHIGYPPDGDGRGAFAFEEFQRDGNVNLSLWNANHKTQTRLICSPTYQGDPIKNREKLVKRMLELRSTLFMSKNLRMTSQQLAGPMTKNLCMGGNAWAALILSDKKCASAYCLWLNSTLGLICIWYCGGRQHRGRALMKLGDIEEFPCPAFSDKTAAALHAVQIANSEFSRLAALNLMPCSYAWRDKNRKQIDTVVLRMMGLDKHFSESDMQTLREEWCREPSVNGCNKEILKALHADKLI